MELFGKIKNRQKEEFFLEISHIHDMETKFDFIEYKNLLFYFHEKILLFEHDKKSNDFWINSNNIWAIFGKKYHALYKETQTFMNTMVEKYFELYNYNILRNESYHTRMAETNFNN